MLGLKTLVRRACGNRGNTSDCESLTASRQSFYEDVQGRHFTAHVIFSEDVKIDMDIDYFKPRQVLEYLRLSMRVKGTTGVEYGFEEFVQHVKDMTPKAMGNLDDSKCNHEGAGDQQAVETATETGPPLNPDSLISVALVRYGERRLTRLTAKGVTLEGFFRDGVVVDEHNWDDVLKLVTKEKEMGKWQVLVCFHQQPAVAKKVRLDSDLVPRVWMCFPM
jgi:hypothetical protein